MKKIVIHKPGGYRQLVIEEHPDLVPGQQQVLIEVMIAEVSLGEGKG